MAYSILVVECSCGFKERSSKFEFGKTIKCPGRTKDGCGKDLVVRMAVSGYPVMFRRGETRTLLLTPEALALPLVKSYPIKPYHKQPVRVLADGPDSEGLVDVELPTPFTYRDGNKTITIKTIPVLYGLLV